MIATRHANARRKERAPWLSLQWLSLTVSKHKTKDFLGFWFSTKKISVVAVCCTGQNRVVYEVRTADGVCFPVVDHSHKPPLIVTVLGADARVWTGATEPPFTVALSALALIARSDPTKPPPVFPAPDTNSPNRARIKREEGASDGI